MFNPGDVVQLKSGGVEWTVAKVEGDVVECVRDDAGKITREEFEAALLKMYEPPKARGVRSVPWT